MLTQQKALVSIVMLLSMILYMISYKAQCICELPKMDTHATTTKKEMNQPMSWTINNGHNNPNDKRFMRFVEKPCSYRQVRLEKLRQALQHFVQVDGTNPFLLRTFLNDFPPNNSSTCVKPKMLSYSQTRLGNQLFQFAHGYAFSLLYDYEFWISDKMATVIEGGFNIKEGVHFKIGSEDDLSETRLIFKAAHDLEYLTLDTDALFLPDGEHDVLLGSYFQSFKYFEFIKTDIRTILSFKKKVIDKANTILQSIVDKYPFNEKIIFIGVHARRAKAKVHIWGSPNATYYYTAMQLYREYFPTEQVHFVVASDSSEWCLDNFNGMDDVTVLQGGTMYEDMCTLSHCNHSIISVGTYSWWSAFLAPGEVIYFKDFEVKTGLPKFNTGNDLYHPDDFYPKEWKGVYGES